MKYLTTLLLCFAIFLCGCEKKQEVSEEQLELIVETINEMGERQNELFENKLNPENIFMENNMTFVEYSGKNNKFSDVCKVLEDICSPEVAEKLMHEEYMYNFDGTLYWYAAAGSPVFDAIDDISDVTVLEIKEDVVALSIKRYCYLTNKSDYVISKYVVKLNKDNAYILDYERYYRIVDNTKSN